MEPITFLNKFYYDPTNDINIFVYGEFEDALEAVITERFTDSPEALDSTDVIEYSAEDKHRLQPIVSPAAFTQTLDILSSHFPEIEISLDDHGRNEIYIGDMKTIQLADVWLIVETLEKDQQEKESLWEMKEQLETQLKEINQQLGIM